MENAANNFDAAFDRWRELYRMATNQYEQANQELLSARRANEQKEAQQKHQEALRQRNLLLQIDISREESDFYPYRYLASEGFLPGYNFPALPIRAWIPRGSKGEYIVDPISHVNLHQSTNDTLPTAGKIALILRIERLEKEIVSLQEAVQKKEKEFYGVRKPGRTQLMDGPPIMLGQEFGAWADALARDRWRLNKVIERIRSVNLGGTAIGTGIGAPKRYILKIVEKVREITKVKIAKAENLIDATQNWDVFAEVHGLLRSLAVNLFKISGDIRLLSSGPQTAIGELKLPSVQAGSSIMPGKINPVIPEYTMQICLLVFSNDVAIEHACSLGNLELNQFAPLIIHLTLKSALLLTNTCKVLSEYIQKINADEKRCKENLERSASNITPLINEFGYEKLSKAIKASNWDIEKAIEILAQEEGIKAEEIKRKLCFKKMTGLGYE